MPVDPELLEILACPDCKTPVTLVKDEALKCDTCHRVYPIKDDIPVMLIDEATVEAVIEDPAGPAAADRRRRLHDAGRSARCGAAFPTRTSPTSSSLRPRRSSPAIPHLNE